MTTISLKDFILTGNFGLVSLGMSKNEVIEYLGQPNETADFETGASGLFYNGFEFFYWTDNDKIFSIQNDNLDQLLTKEAEYKLNDTIIVDTSFLLFRQTLTYKNLTEYLKKQNIIFDTVDKGEYHIIKFLSGVIFDFENEELPKAKHGISNLKLNGIRYEHFD
jgi:hypothetical protein